MLVLAIDCGGAEGSVALAEWKDGSIDSVEERKLAGKTYSAQLTPAIEQLLESRGVGLARIGCLVVANGPGSFTGVRVGLSTAKGLADAAALPLIVVSRLAVLAQKARTRAAALDAGRRQVYFLLEDEQLMESRDAAVLAEQLEVACCEPQVAELFAQAVLIDAPGAVDAILLASGRIAAGDYDDAARVDARYLRPSEAEVVADRRKAARL